MSEAQSHDVAADADLLSQVFDGRSFALGGPASARFVPAPAAAGPHDADGGAVANGDHAPHAAANGRADSRYPTGAMRSDRCC